MLKSQIRNNVKFLYIYIYTPLSPPPQTKFQIVQIPDISNILNLKIRKCQRNARVKTDKGVQPGNWLTISLYEVFEDTKGVIRIHKSKNDRQVNILPLPPPPQRQRDKQRSTKHYA
jgi:hypothetical protein